MDKLPVKINSHDKKNLNIMNFERYVKTKRFVLREWKRERESENRLRFHQA